MTGTEMIQQHLGGQFITEEMMKTADDALGRIGWILSWRKGKRQIWYECCGHTLAESDENDAEEEYALYHADHRKKGICPYCNAAVKEIIWEGIMQHICIGGYVRSYANGSIILLKLRRINEPDKPFHAVEMNDGGKRLVQCRGYKNKTFEQDEAVVRAFWREWGKAHNCKTPVYLTIQKEEAISV